MKTFKILSVLLNLYLFSQSAAEEVTNVSRGARIGDGKEAAKGQFPWQALLWVSKERGDIICGGALIARHVVLTSGACLYPGDAVNDTHVKVSVTLGSVNLNKTSDDSDRIELKSEDYTTHDLFDPFTYEYNFGLVFLGEEVTLNDYVNTIPLSSETLESGVNLVISGWGRINDSIPERLQYRDDLVTISNEECSKKSNIIYDSTVCTVTSTGNDVTGGDGGGALVAGFPDNPRHVGTPSFIGMDYVGSARTASAYDWIQNGIKNHRARKL